MISNIYNLAKSRIANASCRIVDNTTQSLLIVGVDNDTIISHNILDFFALIETQSAIDAIWDIIFQHLFLKGTTLRIGTIEYCKIAITSIFRLSDTSDIITYDNSLLLVTIGWFKYKVFTLVILTINRFRNLPLIMADQTVCCINDILG